MPVRSVAPMTKVRFAEVRRALDSSQRELAAMLGVSEKAVESYEQGWRRIPGNIERMMHFLLARLREGREGREWWEGRAGAEGAGKAPLAPCWELRSCPDAKREACIAWKSAEGRYCWFLSGRLCAGTGPVSENESAEGGDDMLSACRSCPAFTRLHDLEVSTCP